VLKYLRIENSNEWWSKVPAKQCALIAVDVIIFELKIRNCSVKYFEEVKQEIELL